MMYVGMEITVMYTMAMAANFIGMLGDLQELSLGTANYSVQ